MKLKIQANGPHIV